MILIFLIENTLMGFSYYFVSSTTKQKMNSKENFTLVLIMPVGAMQISKGSNNQHSYPDMMLINHNNDQIMIIIMVQ